MGVIGKVASSGARAIARRTVARPLPVTSRVAMAPRRPLSYTQLSHPLPITPEGAALCRMENGEKIPNIFPESEYENRISTLRTYMTENNIGACVFTSYHTILYYTGHLYYSFGRNYACVVKHDSICTISALVDGGNVWRRCYGDNLIYTDWERTNFFKAVKETVGDEYGKLGLEFDHVSLDNYPRFAQLFPKRVIVDIGEPAMRMRLIKSPAEQEVTRQGARIADLGGEAVVEALHEGVPEYEVEIHSTNVLKREVAKTFPQSELRDTFAWIQSGINSDGCHNSSTTRKIQNGDNITINLFAMMQGYYAVLERTLVLNHVSEAQLRYWQINVDVHKRGLELIRPGARCCDIALELNEMYREKDVLQYRTFGYGHSMGAMCHYYGREAGLELREDVTTVLEPGMVLSMEPMIMIPEGREGAGGYREHDILIVTETGAENVTKFPFGPEHNIIKK